MTDLAQSSTNMPRTLVQSAPQDHTYLPLSGEGPFMVYAKVDSDHHPEFALSNVGPTYTDLSWQYPKGTSSTMITFVFVYSPYGTIADLSSNTAGLSFGPNLSGTQVGTVTATPTTYPFTAHIALFDGSRLKYDPQIVVTPQ